MVVIYGEYTISRITMQQYILERERDRAEQESVSLREWLCEFYHSFGYNKYPNRDPRASLSYVYPVESLALAFDAGHCGSEDGSHENGRLKPETLKWLRGSIFQVAQEHGGLQVLPMGHHHVLWESRLYTDDCTMENYQGVAFLRMSGSSLCQRSSSCPESEEASAGARRAAGCEFLRLFLGPFPCRQTTMVCCPGMIWEECVLKQIS